MEFFSKYKKLIPHIIAVFMMLVTLIFVSVAYAWFSNNDKTQANEMTVNAYLPVVVLASSEYTPVNEGDKIRQQDL